MFFFFLGGGGALGERPRFAGKCYLHGAHTYPYACNLDVFQTIFSGQSINHV